MGSDSKVTGNLLFHIKKLDLKFKICKLFFFFFKFIKKLHVLNYSPSKITFRSLDDVRMNFEVVKHCATVLFLVISHGIKTSPFLFLSLSPSIQIHSNIPITQESANPGEDIPIPIPIPSNEAMVEDSSSTTQSDAFTPQTEFLPSNEVSMASITVSSSSVSPYFHGSHKIQILHRDIPLQIRCDSMRIRFGLSTKYLDHAGRPRLSFVVDANSSNLCDLLNACDNITKRFMDSDSNSEWRPLVSRKPGFYDSPTIRFQ